MLAQNSYLFTYGTLKKGFENPFADKLRQASVFISEGYFNGKMYRISWYPGAVHDENNTSKVFGEIYQIYQQEVLDELDEYEDVLEDESASLYVRKMVPVTASSGKKIECWVYLYNQPTAGLDLIKGGNFIE